MGLGGAMWVADRDSEEEMELGKKFKLGAKLDEGDKWHIHIHVDVAIF